MIKLLINAVIVLVVANLILLVSGYRVQIANKVVQPGEHFYAEGWGDLGAKNSPSLACEYWTGKGSKFSVWEYGDAATAKKSCPVFNKVS